MTRLVALDTETTGLKSKEGDRIVEIAMVEITRSANRRYFQSYFNTGEREVNPEAFAVHGLSNEFLTGAQPFEEKLTEIFDCLDGDTQLVIHNAAYADGCLPSQGNLPQ